MSAETSHLSPEHLLAAAIQEAGLEDYGDLDFVGPLGVLLRSVEAEARLGEAGLEGLRAEMTRLLVNRLRLQDDLRCHPEIRDEDVSRPIVITGLPRTGSTKLQRALARDPRFQSVPLWRVLNIAPFPDSSRALRDPRIEQAEAMAGLLEQNLPDLMAAHPMRPEEPEEESMLFPLTFEHPALGFFYRAPTYVGWVEKRPMATTYAYLRTVLQYLQWQDGGRSSRPWVLKSPFHVGFLTDLVETFPGATVVHCHRDPEVALASLCRLVELVRISRGSTAIDLRELGTYLLDHCARAWSANLRQRRAIGTQATILDVTYNDIRDDFGSVAAAVYKAHDLALDRTALDAHAAWQRENPQHRFGRVTYSLEQYGLASAVVRDVFGEYLDLFGGPCAPIAAPSS